MSTKQQKTLFQSWGGNASTCRGKEEELLRERGRGRGRGGLQEVAPVIDLCEEEEEDILLAHALDISCAEEPGSSFEGPDRKKPSTLFSKYGVNNQNEANIDNGNVSVGADNIHESMFPTSCAHEAVSGTHSSDLPGFDKQAGRLWIYPTNYPVRDYQFNIVQQCLYKNTMVTLPTGLGKTFIAAVVMYNFYQWYPQGKIVFMAPTKPLVAQQIDACYNIMGIPHTDTAEMTGTMKPTERQCVWKERRVFFLTPQVITNDLSRGTCPAADVRCLVIDEAHRALGNHAYCQVVRELVKYTKNFRVLALSATPGADIKAVQQVISNLLISQIELRTEDCLDIKPYTHERRVDKIVVPLGEELSTLRDQYTQVMGMVVQRLIRQRAIYNRDPASLSKFLILKAREAFRQDPPQQLPRQQYGVVEGDFALALSLYHGYELLQLHGLRSLYNFLQTVLSGEKGHGRTRTELLKSAVFLQIMDTLRHKFQQDESELSCTQKQRSYVSAHPKMKKLEEVVLEHFDKVHMAGDEAGGETRVMIFSQYRDSVQEITTLLNMHRPRVKAMSFIGQSSAGKSTKGFTQKEQLKVMKEFREGGYNTLISTCVGEEGLDIGDIDLIICFDANKSPIRLVQRMGRTGRKRQGRIVMLVTQGKEEQIYNQSQYSKRSIHKAIMNGARSLHFYQDNPQMLPEGLVPVCHKMFITVNHTQSKNTTANKTVKTQKRNSSFERAGNKGTRREVDEDEPLTKEEWGELQPHLVPSHELRSLPQGPPSLLSLHPSLGGHSSLKNRSLSLNEWMPWQNRLQTWRMVDHSIRSKHLVELIEFIQLQELLEEEDNQYSLEMENFLQLDDVLEGGQQLDDVLEGGQQLDVLEGGQQLDDVLEGGQQLDDVLEGGQQLDDVLEGGQQLDDVLEGGQQLDDVLEGGQQLDDVLELGEGWGTARGEGARRKGRWDMLPALCGGEIGKEEEDLPVFDVGGSSPSRHSPQGQEQLNYQSCTQSHLAKEGEGKKCKVKHNSTFFESFAVDDSGDFEEDKTLIKPQVSDKTMCLVQRKCSRTTFPKDVAIFFDLPLVKNKTGSAQYNGSKVFSIPSPPPLEEMKDVFPKLVDEFAAVNVVRLVSEWYKETLGESVQVRWAKSEVEESLVPASEPHTIDQMDRAVDVTDSKPEAQTFTSIQAKMIQNEVDKNGRKSSQIDTFDQMKRMPLSNEGDDENLKTLLAGVVTRDPERTEASRDKRRNEPVAENKQDGDATLNLTDNQSRKSLSHNSLHEKNSPTYVVTAVKDCLTFTQAMACVQSSDEHSQALSQLSSPSPDPLTTQRKRDLSPDHVSTDKPILDQLTEGNSDLYPSNFAIDRSRLVFSDHFQTEKINYHINNHLDIDKNKDLPSKHLTGDSSRECSPNSDILFCDMPSFNLFEDVSDVDMSKEGADGLTLPIELPCPAASLSDNSDRGFHEEHSDYKTAECKGSQVDLLEDEFDMPHFELNFDLDEDIIPPSPQVSQPFSQKSFNRSQSAPPSKRKLDLGKTKFDSAISENVEAEVDDILCEFSNAALCAASATEHLTRRKDAAPKTPSLLSPLPGQVRSSTPKQEGSRFTKVKKVCHHPPSPPGSLLEEGEDGEQVKGRRKSWVSNPYLTRLSRTGNTISPSSYHTHQAKDDIVDTSVHWTMAAMRGHLRLDTGRDYVTAGLKETAVDLDLDDDSFLNEKRKRSARTLDDSEDANFQLGGPSFKTPSRPTVRCKKRFQMEPRGGKSSSTSSAPSSEDMSSSSLLHQDQAAHTVSERSAFTTRKPKHPTKTDAFKRRPKRPGCEFLDQEAVLSGDSAASSDEFLNSQDDQYELSFVNDHTQMSQLDVDMQAVYLQSVRSPEEVPKRFRLQPRHYRRHIFSPGETGVIQENVDEGSGDEYEEDSFCVAEGDEDTEYVENEEDTLDELENILRNGKRKVKVPRIKTLTFDDRKTRKRIRHFSESSSEDEFKAQAQVSTSEDTHNRTADREDVQELLCSQRAEPAPRRRKLIVCSSDEETSPRAQLQYQSPVVATHHSHTLSLPDASLCSTVAIVTCTPGGATHYMDRGTSHTLGQDMTEMNESKTTGEPALVEQTLGKREVDRFTPHSTERAPVLNRFNQDLQDFDFVSDKLKTSIAKPLALTSEYRQKERVVVLVDSRELSGAQDIISSLRLKHGFTVAARQLEACDYILSCRLAVDRKNLSEFSSGGNRAKLTERLQRMRELYDRCCLIVERDRLKSGDSSDRSSHRSKYCDWIQALLVQTNIRLFYTDNQDETSILLAQLAEMEKKKGLNICVPLHLSTDRDQCIKFYNSIPMLNYANALQLAQSFSSIKEFISRCSPGWLSGAGQMSEVRAAHIITYIKHTFDLQMLPTRR